MKKKIFILLLFILFPILVSGQELELKIECPSNIKKNSEFKCQISAYSNLIVSSLEYEFIVPKNVDFLSFEKASTWEGDEENNLILLYTDENKTKNFEIGELYFKAQENIETFKIDTSYLLFCDEMYNDHLVVNYGKEVMADDENDVKETKNAKKNGINKIIFALFCGTIVIVIVSCYLLQRRIKK